MKTHQTTIGKTDTWFTPPEIIEALGGHETFDLDPANEPPPMRPPNIKTAKAYCWIGENEDGLSFEWEGRIWLNPPFNRNVRHLWMKKMADHNNGIMLIPAACETDAFYKYVWDKATAILFLKGRPHFHYQDGTKAKANSGCTICLVAYGEENAEILERSKLGQVVRWDFKNLLSKPAVSGWRPFTELPNENEKIIIDFGDRISETVFKWKYNYYLGDVKRDKPIRWKSWEAACH